MEETKIVKKIIRKPMDGTEPKVKGGNTDNLFRYLSVITFVMVVIIFFRGFGIKKTVREENAKTQEVIVELNNSLENARQIDKNEILSAFALYSRLDMASLKEREEYHKEQQTKYESMATKFNQGLNNISKQIKNNKDTIK